MATRCPNGKNKATRKNGTTYCKTVTSKPKGYPKSSKKFPHGKCVKKYKTGKKAGKCKDFAPRNKPATKKSSKRSKARGCRPMVTWHNPGRQGDMPDVDRIVRKSVACGTPKVYTYRAKQDMHYLVVGEKSLWGAVKTLQKKNVNGTGKLDKYAVWENTHSGVHGVNWAPKYKSRPSATRKKPVKAPKAPKAKKGKDFPSRWMYNESIGRWVDMKTGKIIKAPDIERTEANTIRRN